MWHSSILWLVVCGRHLKDHASVSALIVPLTSRCEHNQISHWFSSATHEAAGFSSCQHTMKMNKQMFETCMRKGNLPQWILAAFLFIHSFIYLFISTWDHLFTNTVWSSELFLKRIMLVTATRHWHLRLPSRLMIRRFFFLKAKGYFHSGCLLQNLTCLEMEENTSFSSHYSDSEMTFSYKEHLWYFHSIYIYIAPESALWKRSPTLVCVSLIRFSR